jgi:hypothetical protein
MIMKRSSSRLKFFCTIVGLFLILYLSRHFVFEVVFERLLSQVSHIPFEYQSKRWEDKSLIYKQVALGQPFHATQLKLTPTLTFFPPYFALEVYVTEPLFRISTQEESSFYFPPPTSYKLDIERGSLIIDEEPLGFVDFVSSAEPTVLGTLILSGENSAPYCTCEIAFHDSEFYYNLQCITAPALYLRSLMNVFAPPLPFQLQGGFLDADLKGTLSSIQGTLTGSDLQLESDQGEFDLPRLTLEGKWGDTLCLEGRLSGGRFKNETLAVSEIEARLSLHPEKTPLLMMQGQLASGEVKGPFSCETGVYETGAEGKLQFLGQEIPFFISHQTPETCIQADINNIPLTWLKTIAPFQEGLGSAQIAVWFENYTWKKIELTNLYLNLIKLEEFSCSSIRGDAVITQGFFIREALLNVENCSYQLDTLRCRSGSGTLHLSQNQFLTSQIEGTINHIPGKVIWHGPLDQIEGTVSATVPIFSAAEALLKGAFQLKEGTLMCHGQMAAHNDTVFLKGRMDLKTQEWSGSFESPSIQLSNYLSLCSEGAVELKGEADPRGLCLHCVGTDLLFQTEDQLLQIPGRTAPIELKWDFQSTALNLQAPLPPSTLHLKAFLSPIYIESGAVELSYGPLEQSFKISQMAGVVALPHKEFPFHISEITGKEGRYTFAGESPGENILFEGEMDQKLLTLHRAQVGLSHITQPLCVSHLEDQWKLQGGATIDLESFVRYAAFFQELSLPLMRGVVDVKGAICSNTASVDIASDGIQVGDIVLPVFNGHLERDHHRIETDSFSIGKAHLTAVAVCDNAAWHFPEWTVVYKDLHLHGTGHLENAICFLKADGSWKESAIQGEVHWGIEHQRENKASLTIQQKSLQVVLDASRLSYKDGKLEAAAVQTTLHHPLLKESIMASLTLSWTPESMIFQGPLSQGMYENDILKVKAVDIRALYEHGIFHYQTQLQFNEIPLKAKGYFAESGQGAVQLMQGESALQITLATFSDVTRIKGRLLGMECDLTKQDALYEGKLKVETSTPLATLLKKPAWECYENLEFVGVLTSQSFKGAVSGQDVLLQGYRLSNLQAMVDYHPTQFTVRQLKIEDIAGQLWIKECQGARTHPLKSWEVTIPHLRGQQIQPSLLRSLYVGTIDPKPFQIRQLTFTNIKGIVGRPLTFQGEGYFYFTQQEKKDPSLFDLPRAFLKDWGLDLALLSPAQGAANVEIKQGKLLFQSLQETFSDGGHSQFYLAEDEPSYIDFSGGLFLNLRMKQNAVLKLAEPFKICVRGTWEKPQYIIDLLRN